MNCGIVCERLQRARLPVSSAGAGSLSTSVMQRLSNARTLTINPVRWERRVRPRYAPERRQCLGKVNDCSGRRSANVSIRPDNNRFTDCPSYNGTFKDKTYLPPSLSFSYRLDSCLFIAAGLRLDSREYGHRKAVGPFQFDGWTSWQRFDLSEMLRNCTVYGKSNCY